MRLITCMNEVLACREKGLSPIDTWVALCLKHCDEKEHERKSYTSLSALRKRYVGGEDVYDACADYYAKSCVEEKSENPANPFTYLNEQFEKEDFNPERQLSRRLKAFLVMYPDFIQDLDPKIAKKLEVSPGMIFSQKSVNKHLEGLKDQLSHGGLAQRLIAAEKLGRFASLVPASLRESVADALLKAVNNDEESDVRCAAVAALSRLLASFEPRQPHKKLTELLRCTRQQETKVRLAAMPVISAHLDKLEGTHRQQFIEDLSSNLWDDSESLRCAASATFETVADQMSINDRLLILVKLTQKLKDEDPVMRSRAAQVVSYWHQFFRGLPELGLLDLLRGLLAAFRRNLLEARRAFTEGETEIRYSVTVTAEAMGGMNGYFSLLPPEEVAQTIMELVANLQNRSCFMHSRAPVVLLRLSPFFSFLQDSDKIKMSEELLKTMGTAGHLQDVETAGEVLGALYFEMQEADRLPVIEQLRQLSGHARDSVGCAARMAIARLLQEGTPEVIELWDIFITGARDKSWHVRETTIRESCRLSGSLLEQGKYDDLLRLIWELRFRTDSCWSVRLAAVEGLCDKRMQEDISQDLRNQAMTELMHALVSVDRAQSEMALDISRRLSTRLPDYRKPDFVAGLMKALSNGTMEIIKTCIKNTLRSQWDCIFSTLFPALLTFVETHSEEKDFLAASDFVCYIRTIMNDKQVGHWIDGFLTKKMTEAKEKKLPCFPALQDTLLQVCAERAVSSVRFAAVELESVLCHSPT